MAILRGYGLTRVIAMRHAWPIVLLAVGFLQEPTPNPPAPTAEVTAKIVVTKDGGLIILDAGKSIGAKSFEWEVLPAKTPGFLVIDGGRRAVFAPGKAGQFTIVLAVAGDGGELDIETVTFREGPGPGPNPPGPDPVSLAELATQWADAVDSPTKAADASKLANAFETVAAQLAAGALPEEPERILAATKSIYEMSLGSALAAWRPWLDSLGAYMTDHDSGDYVTQWNEIAAGLRAVR